MILFHQPGRLAAAALRQSREEFAAGDTYTAEQVRAELEQRRRRGER